MTEAKRNKYSDQWFRREASKLELTPGKDIAEKIFAVQSVPKRSSNIGSKRILAVAAVGLLAVLSFSLSRAIQEPESSVIIELSSSSEDNYFKSYSDFLRSDQYVRLEEAYALMTD